MLCVKAAIPMDRHIQIINERSVMKKILAALFAMFFASAVMAAPAASDAAKAETAKPAAHKVVKHKKMMHKKMMHKKAEAGSAAK